MGRRFRFFAVEALRSIRTNAAISFAATATVLIAIAMLGAFLSVFFWSDGQLDSQQDKLDLRAYLKIDATTADFEGASKALQDHPNVDSVVFRSAEDILAEKQKEVPDLLAALPSGYNPYPATFIIKPDNPESNEKIVNDLSPLAFWLKDKTSPSGFSFDQETNRKYVSALHVLRWGGFSLMLMLVIAAVLLIGNTIRLSIFARRREVEVMRLVGATNWFIRWPFIIEGLIFGVIGAVAAVLLLLLVKVLIVDQFLDIANSPFSAGNDTSLGLSPLALMMIAAGAVLGALGSGITLRRFLRV